MQYQELLPPLDERVPMSQLTNLMPIKKSAVTYSVGHVTTRHAVQRAALRLIGGNRLAATVELLCGLRKLVRGMK